ncbi:MAG: hypothetical protein HYZ11_09980 [Candidatus Tectomicrobia bacterium]|uniref:Cbb3-type cytochrome c oxidase subunit I n=1 Tax=Tectimicrobiota bacterium TaxID=2528274 RepID=A0A932HYF9_UNCTE|nr:hypothetical protein [Candidatus Tectomicrobia bacterium]
MPPVIRLYVKTSLAFFILTFSTGSAFMLMNALYRTPMPRDLALLHAHMGLVGWLGLMVMGVAWWMFPLMKDQHRETRGRYHLPTAYAVYYLTVGGLLLRLAGEPWFWRTGHPFPRFLLIVSAAAQLAGVLGFTAGIWGRVRPIGESL